MQVKPIKTVDDNRAALARIEQLWDAEPNTPRSEEPTNSKARCEQG